MDNYERRATKSNGISATVIDRMTASPTLPQPLRAKIIEYVEEKAAGRYGHSRTQRRRFVEKLSDQTSVRVSSAASLHFSPTRTLRQSSWSAPNFRERPNPKNEFANSRTP